MKTILQKHTSKFVANLLNGLGIIACVSLTACGNEKGKDKQTENEKGKGKQTEDLVKKLKENDFYKNLAEDEKSLKKIAEWLNENGKDENYNVTNEDLDEIFSGSNSGVRVGDKKLVEVPKGTTSSPGVAAFGSKGNKLEKKEQVSLKIEGKGKISIVKGDTVEKSFTFNTIENFQSFVDFLKDKEITTVDDNWSLKFEGENVKICGHETGFCITGCFGAFFDCLNTLVGFEKLNIPNLSLKIEGGKLSLNEVECTDGYFKNVEFWKLVKDHTALFGITDTNKFKIEKNGDGDSATIKIDKFETFLNWSDVVEKGDNAFVVDSGWDRIFELGQVGVVNGQSGSNVPGGQKTEEKTFKWMSGGKYSLGGNEEKITLENLKKLVGTLNGENITFVEGDVKFDLKFNGVKVMLCDDKTGLDVLDKTDSFNIFLDFVTVLKKKNFIDSKFYLEIGSDESSSSVKIGGGVVNTDVVKSQNFWDVVKNNKELFKEGGKLDVKVVRGESDKKKGKIGNTTFDFDVFEDASGNNKVNSVWNSIFVYSEN